MAVNADLAILMRVIEDQQDKMPEGEYLAAMNALGALHREIPQPPPSYDGLLAPLNEQLNILQHALIALPLNERDRWFQVYDKHSEHRGITPEQWTGLSEDQQNQFLRETAWQIATDNELTYRNPDPKLNPFIARHAMGPWRITGNYTHWNCVCGYKGKTENWKKHEESERHQDWAKHRTVSRRMIDKMKRTIDQDQLGELIRINPRVEDVWLGGITYFPVNQERNEWTHPSNYLSVESIGGKWVVHHREDCQKIYIP
jgi:hypothetical protein